MTMDQAVASNWVLEKFSDAGDSFTLTGTTKGYASFSRAFQDGTTVFYAASDDDGNREAGWGVYRGNKITERVPTATLSNGQYVDTNPSRLSFRKGGTIAGTFNAIAFNELWKRDTGAGMVISVQPPSDPITGMQWLDSSTAEVWIWDDDKWLQFPVGGSGGGVGANVQIEEWPPEYANVGDMWTDYGTTGELYIWDGRFWVSMTGDGGPKVILGGDGGGEIELPENITLDNLEDPSDVDKALARHISAGGVGKWLPIKTGDVETDPSVTFRDANGRFKSTKKYEDLTDQLKVNRFLAAEIESHADAIDSNRDGVDEAKAGIRRIDNQVAENTSSIIQLRDDIDGIEIPEVPDLPDDLATLDDVAEAVGAEADTRRIADEGLQKEIEDLSETVANIDIPDLDGYATEEYVDSAIEGIEFPETDLSDYYTKGEVDESQGVQDDRIDGLQTSLNQETIDRIKGDTKLEAEIEEIALILNTLANSIENGNYNYVGDSIPTQAGQFSLAFPDVTTTENIITFNEVDADGSTHNLPSTVSVDDYLEIVDVDDPEDFGLWQVTEAPDGTGIFSVQVKLVKAGNTFDVGDRCEARFFSVSDELDMNELDARYLRLAGGTMTGKLTTPDIEVKTRDYTTASLYLHGHRDNANVSSAEIVMHNRYHANAKGTISWEASTGNNGKFKFDDRVIFGKGQQVNANGFTVKGYVSGSAPNGDLLYVYHNNNAQDAVLYKGKQTDDQDHLATTKWTVGKIETAIGNIEFPEPDLSDYLPLAGGTMTGTLNFGRDHRVLARINPAGGTTQEIDLFESNSGGQTLRFDLQGATYRNAIEFESGPSTNKKTILRMDSNNGIRVHGLSADDTKITDVAEPTEDSDAANKQYVDSTVKSEVDGNFVSKVGGDEMQGPFKIQNNPDLDTRDARKLEVLNINSGSENSSLNLGAKNTTVYIGANQTTFVKPILVDDIGEKNEGHNVNFLNTTTAPRAEVKTGESASEAVMLLEGNRTGTSNPSARITMSNNENANAYGSLSWKGINGQGWFEFNKDVDLAGHGLHSVTRVRLNGDKAICDGNVERIKVGGKVEIKRVGANTDGFKVEGRVNGDNTAGLLGVYHNSGDNDDAVNYFGKQVADENLATVGYVKDQITKIDIPEPDLDGYLPLDGSDPMTGDLTAPRVNIKTPDYGDGVLLVEGKRDNINAVSARVTFSNRYNSNAYGSIQWYASSSNNGYFKFTDKVKLATEGTADNDLVTKAYVDSKAGGSQSVGSLVSTSFGCKWKQSSSTDAFTFYTQNENGSSIMSHASTKFINVRLPSDFWTVRAGVVPAGRDMGYITVIDPANGQIVYSGSVITVSSGGTTFKVDVNKQLWTNNPTYWATDKMYLIRMESCFREQ